MVNCLEHPESGWKEGDEGCFLGLPAALYHAADGVNQSKLKYVDPSARLDAYDAQEHSGEVWAIIGQLVHSAILEPSKPLPQIEIQPKELWSPEDGKMVPWSGDGNRPKVRAAWKAEQEAAGKLVLTKVDWDTVLGCVESLANNRDVEVRELLASHFTKGQSEVSLFRRYIVNGVDLMLKCRIDFVLDGADFLHDVKTLGEGETNLNAFEKVLTNYKMQGPSYLNLFNEVTGEKRHEFRMIGVEKKPPYLARVFRVEQESLRLGMQDYLRRLGLYADSIKASRRCGWPPKVVDVGLPRWEKRLMDEQYA